MSAIDEFDLELAYSVLEMYLEDRIDSDLMEERMQELVKSKADLYLFLVFAGLATGELIRSQMPRRIRAKIKRNRRKGLHGGVTLSIEDDEEEQNTRGFQVTQAASQIVVAFVNDDEQMAVDLTRAVMSRGSDIAGDVMHKILYLYRITTRGPDDQCPAFGKGHDHD